MHCYAAEAVYLEAAAASRYTAGTAGATGCNKAACAVGIFPNVQHETLH